jgi:hypothetical protein
MVAMGMVQSSIHEVIDMIPVGHAFVSARRVVRVRTARLWGTLDGVGGTNFDEMLINMILMHMMKMTVMEIIDVVLMAYCCMSTMRTVPVSMVRVLLLATSGHRVFPLSYSVVFYFGGRPPPQTTVANAKHVSFA